MSEESVFGSGWSVLLEDGPVLVINKSAGLLTQAPPGVPSLEGEVKAWLKERFGKAGNVYLGIPHRLDRAVSGAIVFARNSKAAARLAEQFEKRQVRKIYWAIVEGVPQPSESMLTDWLLKLPQESRAEVVTPETPGARECRLSYRTLAAPLSEGSDLQSLIEVELHTGRMHQIRVQLASRGWPVVGDSLYGSKPRFLNEGVRENSRDEPIALHARSLTFQHPVRYDQLTITASLPVTWPKAATDFLQKDSSCDDHSNQPV